MSIRARIVLLSTALMAVVLVSVSLGVYQMLMRSLESDIDQRLLTVVDSYREESRILTEAGGQLVLRAPEDLDPFTYPGLYLQVLNHAGGAEVQSPQNISKFEIPETVMAANMEGNAVYYTDSMDDNYFRAISAPLKSEDGAVFGTVQAYESLRPMGEALDQLKLFLITGSLIGLTMTAMGSYLLAGQSLRPLTTITSAIRRVGQSRDLKHQIRTPATGDEIQQLADTFNHMLVRLDAAFHAERRFVGDASHELRTPLTALRGNAEILLRQLNSDKVNPDDMREGLSDIRDEAERMGRLVENLLTLARADVGWRPEMEHVVLDQVLADAARLVVPLSGEHEFVTEIDTGLNVDGNPDQLRQLLLILLDNAFAYTPAGRQVTLRATTEAGFARVDIIDAGPGMSEDQIDRIFDRFFRGNDARNGGTSGAGLGLAIARWITDCHAGHITAFSEPGNGTRMTVRIPLRRDIAPEPEPEEMSRAASSPAMPQAQQSPPPVGE